MAQQKNFMILFVFLLFITYAYAATIAIGVGGPNGILKFDPQNVTNANVGDIIQWNFLGGDHSVVQSDGLGSCDQSQKANPFQSTTNPPSKMFTTTVQDTNTIYYFCGFASHCQNGMWGTIYVVGGPAPPPSAISSTNSTTNSTNSTVTTTPSISSKSNAANFAGDFKLVTFATIIVFTLFKYLV